MNVLVLGGDGFLGSHFVDHLLELGHDVTVFGRFRTGVTRNLEHLRRRIKLFSGEFANRDDIARAIERQDVVYHFISTTDPVSSWNDPFIEIEENIKRSVQFFEIAAQAGIGKVVFLSSGGTVYGRQEGVIQEDALQKPFAPYGIGKATIEHFLNYYQQHGRLKADIYRIGNAFGPRQPLHRPQGVIANWINNILNGKEVLVYGDSSTVRDYIYVGDVAQLIGQSLTQPEHTGTYNVGSGHGIAVTELLEIFNRIIDRPFSYRILPRRECDNISVILDSQKILKRCPEFSFSNFEEKLLETWNYLKNTMGCVQ